jgi:acetyl-CoA acetyltransferase
LAARSGIGVAQVSGLLDIAPDDRPDRVGLEAGARRRGPDGDRAKIGRWDVQGGAIAHGHPIGATGAVLTTRLIHSMRRDGLERH